MAEYERKGGDNMKAIDTAKLTDAQLMADNLAKLPVEARLYIAGYAEGRRDRSQRRKKKQAEEIRETGQ